MYDKANLSLIVCSEGYCGEMEAELELLTDETDAVQVMQKLTELDKKATELGFSVKEVELESEEEDEEAEKEE